MFKCALTRTASSQSKRYRTHGQLVQVDRRRRATLIGRCHHDVTNICGRRARLVDTRHFVDDTFVLILNARSSSTWFLLATMERTPFVYLSRSIVWSSALYLHTYSIFINSSKLYRIYPNVLTFTVIRDVAANDIMSRDIKY